MLNYQLEGVGPPLLLLHGFGISFNIWTELSPRLRDHFKLVTVELPGIGRSPFPPPAGSYLAAAVDALDSLRTSLGLPRWNVLSYSSGTRVAETYLHEHHSHVDRAVFLCPAQVRSNRARGLQLAERVDARVPRAGNWVLSGWRLKFLIHLLGFNLQSNERVPAWYREITSQPVDVLKETLRSLPDGGARPFDLPADIPALFIWGREDWITVTPRRSSPRDVIIHANHSMPQTRAHEVAEILLPFLM